MVRGTLDGVTETVFGGRRVNLSSGEGRTADDNKNGNWFGCVRALLEDRRMRDSIKKIKLLKMMFTDNPGYIS